MAGKLSGLSSRARLQYEERGYYFPVAVLDSSEVAEFRAHFIDHLESNRKVLKALPPKDHYVVLRDSNLSAMGVSNRLSSQSSGFGREYSGRQPAGLELALVFKDAGR